MKLVRSYVLYENIKLAKEYLESKNIIDTTFLNKIINRFKSKPELVNNFIRYHYEQGIEQEEVIRLADWVMLNAGSIKYLSKRYVLKSTR
jgi:hypothetical protein